MSRPATRVALLALAVLCCRPTVADLKSDLDRLAAPPELKYALLAAHVIDVTTGEVLYSRNADIRMMPASNQKLITTSAAYDLLSPRFVYHTPALAESKPSDQGVVSGPIYLKGSGDPSLTFAQLTGLAQRVRAIGVRRVRGGVVADAGAFDEPRVGPGWAWDYLDDSFAAEVAALTVDGGCATVIVRGADEAGLPPVMRLEPFSDYLCLAPGAVTGAKGIKTPGLSRQLGRNLIELSGPLAAEAKVDRVVTVHQPPLYAATLFRQELIKAGVEVEGKVGGGETPKSALELLHTNSRPLGDLLTHVNKHSDNNFAEALLLTLSLVKEGVGTRGASVKLIDRWAGSFGADPLAFCMVDGSGLSRLNTVTPRFLVQVLGHMRDKEDWVATLPIMGRDGTLSARLKGTPAEGKIRAKTGYIGGVRTLCGYATTASGRRLAFAFMANGALDTGAVLRMENKACLRFMDL